MKVLAQGETTTVPSKKSESGQMNKSVIHLKELRDFGDEVIATMLGEVAACRFEPNSVVAVNLRLSTHENNGQIYQDILVNDIVKLK